MLVLVLELSHSSSNSIQIQAEQELRSNTSVQVPSERDAMTPVSEQAVLVGMTLEGRSCIDTLEEEHEEQEEDSTEATSSSMSSLSPDMQLYQAQSQAQSQIQSPSQTLGPPTNLQEVPGHVSALPTPSGSPGSDRTATFRSAIGPGHGPTFHSVPKPHERVTPYHTATTGAGAAHQSSHHFRPQYVSTRLLQRLSKLLLLHNYSVHENSTWIGFWALLCVTCANYVLTPMRDAVALAVGVSNLPKLTLASTLLAVLSSVPIGWLFEAPDPKRLKLWKRMGLTRGDTQGTSLALFYRAFMICILSYAFGFFVFRQEGGEQNINFQSSSSSSTESASAASSSSSSSSLSILYSSLPSGMWSILQQLGQLMYIAFFLVVHLMKLHSLSLIWGVTTEAMEYEDAARKRRHLPSSKTRLQRLSFIGFGGTLGGILGSILASSMAHILKLSGLLVVAALLLELSAELATELGRTMQRHWEEQQLVFQASSEDLASLDPSMKRSSSVGSMKRVASGNSINKVRSFTELASATEKDPAKRRTASMDESSTADEPVDDNTFTQRLLRGVTTILRSRLLMSIFTYNALYASTSVLLSFQRAALVVARSDSSSTESDTAFLANINMASSVAIFALQASGAGAYLASKVGSQFTLCLMPLVRLMGVLALAWWHRISNGQPPNLILFLLLDECTRVMNMAVAKPVRESLWRGLSNEARYEAKPIVDTLANRWGGGSAAFLVSFTDKMLDVFGVGIGQDDGSRTMFGYPPILFLCMAISAWWTMTSIDLGQIRGRIDVELKKHQ